MYDKISEKLKQEHKKRKTGIPGDKKGKPEDIPDFARAMKELRESSGLSLEKLSRVTGINKQTLHSLENYSIKNPSFANLEKIAAAFNLSLQDFLLRARGEYRGNLFKTTAGQRWEISFELE